MIISNARQYKIEDGIKKSVCVCTVHNSEDLILMVAFNCFYHMKIYSLLSNKFGVFFLLLVFLLNVYFSF